MIRGPAMSSRLNRSEVGVRIAERMRFTMMACLRYRARRSGVTTRNRDSNVIASGSSKAKPNVRRNFTDRKSTRLNSSHGYISYAVFCLKKKKKKKNETVIEAAEDCGELVNI